MNKNYTMLFGFILFGFVFNSVIASPTSAILRFGFFAEDGTLIQPYIETEGRIGNNKTIVPVFIPQYLKTLEFDEFILYCEFPDEDTHTLELVLQRSIVVTVTEQDNDSITGYRQYNETIWVDSDNMDLVINNQRGYGKYRYIEMIIDETVFSAFDQSNVTEKFVIRYQNLSIEFFHKTNPYFFDVTQNLGEFQLTLILSAFLTGIFSFVCIRIAKKLQERTMGIWFPISFSTVFLVATWGMGLTALFLFFAATSGSDIQWQIAILPVPVLNFIVAAVVGLWTPSEFQKKLEEHYILDWDLSTDPFDALVSLLQNADSKIQEDASNLVMRKYYVYREGKKIYYFNKKNSIKEVFQAIIWGPRTIKNIEKTFTLKAKDKKQKTMFVEDISIRKELASDNVKRLEGLLLVGFFVSLSATLISQNEIITGIFGFIAGILIVVTIIIANNHWYFVTQKVKGTKDFLFPDKKNKQWVSLAKSVTIKKKDLPIEDRNFQLKLIVPIVLGAIFLIGGVLSSSSDLSSALGFISIIFLVYAFLVYLYEYFKLRDETSITPLSRNIIAAIYNTLFAQIAEEKFKALSKDFSKFKKEFYMAEGETEGDFIVDWEMMITGKKLEDLPVFQEKTAETGKNELKKDTETSNKPKTKKGVSNGKNKKKK
ncbi:MAG: hypothetical protein ACTSP4_00145 [Candidatus Hodarchaeales archaeon]